MWAGKPTGLHGRCQAHGAAGVHEKAAGTAMLGCLQLQPAAAAELTQRQSQGPF